MVSEDVQTIADANFQAEVLDDRGLALVDFWAAWCGPCMRLAPTVDAVATELRGRTTVGTLNVDDNPEAAGRFNVRSIPTLMLFKEGRLIVQGHVSTVDLSTYPLTVDRSEESFTTWTLIIATGASARLLGLASERALMGHGVSTCATCDGYFFRGRPIAIAGGGDSALEEALFLSKLASHVTVIHRRDTLRASKIMQEKALTNPKMSFIWNTVVEDIDDTQQGVVTGIRLRHLSPGERSRLDVEGLFVAIGHRPNTSLFVGQLGTDRSGYIVTTSGTRTSVPGVFACGDVQDHVYRQAVTAAGSGCMAAIDVERFLAGTLQVADVTHAAA